MYTGPFCERPVWPDSRFRLQLHAIQAGGMSKRLEQAAFSFCLTPCGQRFKVVSVGVDVGYLILAPAVAGWDVRTQYAKTFIS